MNRILIATDGSDGGNRALDAACELAKATGSTLVIVTIGGDVTGAELRRLASTGGDLSKTLETRSNRILEQAGKRAQRLGITAPVLRHAWGDPAEVIIDMVQREKADAVVVGRRGRGRLSELLLGSVSQKVASLAPCTVIVVP
jgi:nucleotide-binding universal stress UspA family protein